MMRPKFGPTIKSLNSKAITITGYVIPVDLDSGVYVLSEMPMAACFFCGGAGAESIMQLRFNRLPDGSRPTSDGRFKLYFRES